MNEMKTKKKRPWLKFLVAGVVAVAVLGILLRPTVIEVESAVVDRGTLSVTVEDQGRTRARHRYTVAAPITGRVLRTDLDEGDLVGRGDLLVNMAPPPEDSRTQATSEAQLEAAQARQREAQALLEESASNYRRAQSEAERRAELYEKNLVSIETRDSYRQAAEAGRARVDSATASLAAARADVESARSRLLGIKGGSGADGMVTVEAPVDGQILRVFEESERVVQAGSPLFLLGQGNEMELVIDLLTEDAVKVGAGNPILVTGWGGSAALNGVVRYVEPGAFTKISTLGVEEQRVNVIGDLLDAPVALGAEFRIQAAIVIWVGEDVLMIPTSAIFRRVKVWHTFLIEDGRAHLREISIGQRGTEYAEVLDGVEEGDQVIQFPSDLIEEGVRVKSNQRGTSPAD